MKKGIIGIIGMMMILSVVSAGDVPVNMTSTIETNCTESNADVYYYLTGTEYHWPSDIAKGFSKDIFVDAGNSEVRIWTKPGVISNCSNWTLLSNVIPSVSNPMGSYRLESQCYFNIPTSYTKELNPTGLDGQISYKLGYHNKKSVGGTQISKKFYYTDKSGNQLRCYPGGNIVSDVNSCPSNTYRQGGLQTHEHECINYRVFRCGDGLVNGRSKNGATITNYDNGTYTEQCDPALPSPSGKRCTPNCQLQDIPTQDPVSCTISLNASTINLGDPVVVSYAISGEFKNPARLNGNIPNSVLFPYAIYRSGAYTAGAVTVSGEITAPGIYIFEINGTGLHDNLAFSCRTRLVVNKVTNTGTTGLAIEKSLESVGPFYPGDEIRYKIIATNTGTMTGYNIYIRDIMPQYVNYLTSTIYFVPSSNQHPNFGTRVAGNRGVFEYSGITLAPGQKAIIMLTGRVSGLPQTVVQNIAGVAQRIQLCEGFTSSFYSNFYNEATRNCAVVGGSGYDEDEDCAEFPVPYMVKTQSVRGIDYTHDDVVVATNEYISYRVDFGNRTGSMMKNVVLKDVMPSCVSYLTSTVYGITGYTFRTGINNGNIVIYYSGFNLSAGQTGYMLLTGKISNSSSCQNVSRYRNYAYLYYSGGYIQDNVLAKRPRISVTKTGDGPHYKLNDSIRFHITVKNNGPDTAYDILLEDVWPNIPSGCVNYDGWTGTVGITKDPNAMKWKYPGAFYTGQRLDLYLSGTIGSNPECIKNYVNNVLLDYHDGSGHHYTGQDNYPFDVTGSDAGYLSKVVDRHEVKNGEIVGWTITYKNNGIVDWDTGYILTDTWPGDVLDYISSDCTGTCSESHVGNTYLFTFNEVLHPGEVKTLGLKGRVKTGWENKKWNYVDLDYHTIFGNRHLRSGDWIEIKDEPVVPSNCGNGKLEGTEECDGGYDLTSYDGGIFYILNYLDYNKTTLAGVFANNSYYCTESCKLERLGGDSYNIPSCLNVDTTISIMEGEIFPFWWRIWMSDGITFVNDNSCSPYTSSNNDTKINKNSMKCTFSVYDGKGYNQQNKRSLETFTVPCFSGRDSSLNQYFKPFDNESCVFSRCVDFDKVASRQAWNVSTLLGTGKINTYGEYKLALEKVEYEYCASDGTWKKGKLYDSVCEVNFALTKPYLMQINTAGVPQATSTNFLNNFYDIAGHKIETDINNVITTTDSSYDTNVDVSSQISQFKKKYESLAVAVTTSNWNGASSVKKVPGKSIYFVKGNGSNLVITNSILKVPFTVFVEGMNVIVDGSININGMIITDKKIEFRDSTCTSGGQVVQGIFIAGGGFTENKSTLNTSVDRSRCHRGNLKVKGVLIGNGILNIIKSKRSQLNSRFQTSIPYDETDELKAERRIKIINGASLLIEYNPDLWSNIIPGSEIFTQTLNVYKK